MDAMLDERNLAATVATVLVVAWAVYFLQSRFSKTRKQMPSSQKKKVVVVPEGATEYDVIVVGGSIAGCTVAKRLCDQGKRVLVVERDLSRPDRIVGELLQPGGIDALKVLGMESCAEDVGVTCVGYYAFQEGEQVELPFQKGYNGVSFHFGDFVMNLRSYLALHCKKPHNQHGEQVELSHHKNSNSGGFVKIQQGAATELLVDKEAKGSLEGRAYGLKFKATKTPQAFLDHTAARRGQEGVRLYPTTHLSRVVSTADCVEPDPTPTKEDTKSGSNNKRASSSRGRSHQRLSANNSSTNTDTTTTTVISNNLEEEKSATPVLRSGSPSRNDTAPVPRDDVEEDAVDGELLGEQTALAPLILLCDGGGSNFRHSANINAKQQDWSFHSHFIGVILKGVTLPFEGNGHVFLGKKGPILCYRLDPGEVRVLVDYKGPSRPQNKLPSMEIVQKWMQEAVSPDMPIELSAAFDAEIKNVGNIRSMGIPYFTQLFPRFSGVVGLGDHANQRHPLTGGGMTCAMRDSLELAFQLSKLGHDFPSAADASGSNGGNSDSSDALIAKMDAAVATYTKVRTSNVGCINILSFALYYVFEGPLAMRRACFHYFYLGGDAIAGPVSMLSGLRSSVLFLLYHYYRVMFYGAYLVTVNDPSQPLQKENPAWRKAMWFATFLISPTRIFTTLHLIAYATKVFLPLVINEFLQWRRFV